jgi:hypothetical protein
MGFVYWIKFVLMFSKLFCILVSVSVFLGSCSEHDTSKKPDVVIRFDSTEHGYDELANPDSLKAFAISDYNTDNPDVKNIARPDKPIINTSLDTALLFGIWTSDPDGAHADFDFTRKSFYIVDYDGNGDMPYHLIGDQLTIYYNDFIQEGQILSVTRDTLKLRWKDYDEPNFYVRWKE